MIQKAYFGGGCELEGVCSFVIQSAKLSPALLWAGQVESVQIGLAVLANPPCRD